MVNKVSPAATAIDKQGS